VGSKKGFGIVIHFPQLSPSNRTRLSPSQPPHQLL